MKRQQEQAVTLKWSSIQQHKVTTETGLSCFPLIRRIKKKADTLLKEGGGQLLNDNPAQYSYWSLLATTTQSHSPNFPTFLKIIFEAFQLQQKRTETQKTVTSWAHQVRTLKKGSIKQ